nr:hypothetical protein [Tanacetum cinerariifolium]
ADMKEILHQCMWESDSYKSHEDHMQLFEALEKSINRDHFEELAHDLAEARKKRKKDLEYLRYDSKGCRPALSISKMKAAYYPDAGLEQMVPDQFWIKEECKYDIAAMYGISHWWFQRQRFYIDRHTSEGDRSTVRTHMRILSVVRIEVFSMYGYDYMKKIVLRRADLNEHVIAERDFKYLYPSDFKDLNILNLQGYLNHLPPKDKKILTTATQVNLTKPQWTATGFEYKHDYTVIESPRDVIFRDKYGVQMMMRFNEIHKFSDGTLQQIVEALDYRVKEFRINRMNPGIPTVAAAGQKDVNSQLHAHSSNLSSMNSKKTYDTASATLMYAVMIQDRVSMRVLMSQPHKMVMFHNKDD